MIVDTDTNRAAYVRLIELVRSGEAIAFAGAGVAAPLGYPDWPGVVARLAAVLTGRGIQEIQINGQTIAIDRVLAMKALPLVQVQILKSSLGDDYFRALSDLFGPKEKTIASISDLVELPFRHFLTSNYDPCLEKHHNPSNPPESICLRQDAAANFIQTFADARCPRHVVHVHGRYDDPSRIVLTEEDYGVYERDATVRLFWSQVTLKVVFFGCSLEDADLLSGFRNVRRTLNNHQAEPRHFAIMPLADADQEQGIRIQLEMRYGIQPVFFPKPGQSFSEYDDLLSRLKAEVLSAVPEQARAAPIEAEILFQPMEPVAAQPDQAVPDVALSEGIEHLKQMTRATIERRHTGDPE